MTKVRFCHGQWHNMESAQLEKDAKVLKKERCCLRLSLQSLRGSSSIEYMGTTEMKRLLAMPLSSPASKTTGEYLLVVTVVQMRWPQQPCCLDACTAAITCSCSQTGVASSCKSSRDNAHPIPRDSGSPAPATDLNPCKLSARPHHRRSLWASSPASLHVRPAESIQIQ